MAYLDLNDIFAAPTTARTAAVPLASVDAAAGFSPLEWSVVALAKHDSLRSIGQPSRMARALGSLFGLGTASPLADERLEALRRLAVHAWHRGFALPAAEIERFRSAGFGDAQLETLVTSVTGLRAGGVGSKVAK